MSRTILAVVIFVHFQVSLSLEQSSLQLSCQSVKEEFVRRNIGLGTLVPPTKQQGSDLQVCKSTSESSGPSCCTSETEPLYSQAATTGFYQTLHSTTSQLKATLKNNRKYYEEQVVRRLEDAENNTKGLFVTLYSSIPISEQHATLSIFFLDLQLYIKQYDVDVTSAIEKFFNNLFPLVFEHLLLDRSKIEPFDKGYKNCLIENRANLYPDPFGEAPRRLQEQLGRSLSIVRLYLGGLELLHEALDRLDNITLSEECVNALTRMQFCSHCAGLTEATPCQNLCLNTVQGCLAGVAGMDDTWAQFLNTLGEFVVSSVHNFEDVLGNIYMFVSESVAHAMENTIKFYDEVVDTRVCGLPKTRGAGASTAGELLVFHNKMELPREFSMTGHSSTALLQQMEGFVTSLKASNGFYSSLGPVMCAEYVQSTAATECWNGYSVGPYTKPVTNLTFSTQVQGNPEVKVQNLRPQQLQRADDRLTTMTKLLASKASSMMKDEPYYMSRRSHDRLFNGAGHRYDDEDDENSGSGSGGGGGWGMPYKPYWKVIKPDESVPDRIEEDDRMLTTKPQTTVKAVSVRKEQSTSDPNTSVTFTPNVCLLIFIVTRIIL